MVRICNEIMCFLIDFFQWSSVLKIIVAAKTSLNVSIIIKISYIFITFNFCVVFNLAVLVP